MANGSTILELKDMLSRGEKIPAAMRDRFIYTALINLYDQQTTIMGKIGKMYPAYTIVMWIGGVLGLLIIGFIWAVITHQVTIIH
jgi:hypothetical protein